MTNLMLKLKKLAVANHCTVDDDRLVRNIHTLRRTPGVLGLYP